MAFVFVSLFLTIFASLHVSAFPNEQPASDIFRSIPVTRCCPEKYAYNFLSTECIEQNDIYHWPPTFYSTRFNVTLPHPTLDVTDEMISCNENKASFVSTDFILYQDGSVLLSNGMRLTIGEFCVSPLDANAQKDGSSTYVVRYCGSDPCTNAECVRKCCPMGYAMNATINKCQSAPDVKFEVDFRNESGHAVPPAQQLVVRDGNAPLCHHGMYLLDPDVYPNDEFYILPDGQLYQPKSPKEAQYTDVYCVENFIDEKTAKFQALVCFPAQSTQDNDDQFALAVFPIFLFLSSFFLVATFVVYAILPEIRNVHGVTIMCHVASLCVMYVGLGVIQLTSTLPDGVCVVFAVVVHFAFLSTFTWLNVMSFDIWWTFSLLNTSRRSKTVAKAFWMRSLGLKHIDTHHVDRPNNREACLGGINDPSGVSVPSTTRLMDNDALSDPADDLLQLSNWDLRPRKTRNGRLGRRFIFYSLYAWGVPFVIVAVGQILESVKKPTSSFITPGFGTLKCWFSQNNAFWAYLYGPVAVLILSNIVFFAMTASLLYQASVDAAFAANRAHAKQKLRVIFSLFILMGVSWMSEVISFAVGGSAYIWIPTDILNILTGLFIFVIFVCKPNVWKLLKMKFPCFERVDVCCPKYMKRSGTRQETMRVTRNESLPNNKGNDSGITSDDDSKRPSSYVTSATRTTQMRDSSQVDSGDEMLVYHDKN